ncbi:MAG TPA: hypothetical protein ENJ54_09850 [Chloroflexi bacterium]|nr:hypothetical protein [Chloroflexota bacterium]
MTILPEPLTSSSLAPRQSALVQPKPAGQLAARLTRPTVSAVLKRWGPWKCCMALLGVCEDGVPLAARWTQPRKASHYLYLGGDEMTLATVVEPLLYSIAYQGKVPPRFAGAPDASRYAYGRDRIRYAIVSPPSTWWSRGVAEAEHCAGIVPPESEEGRKLLAALRITMHTRLKGRAKTPQVQTIVVLHDLGAYWHKWDDEAREAWRDVLARGHTVGIHLVVTLRYSHLVDWEAPLPDRKLYGAAGSQPLPNLPIVRDLAAMGLGNLPAYMGMTRSGGRWMKFVAPSIG